MSSEKESNSFDEQNSKAQQHNTEHEMKDIDEISKFVLEDAGESDRMKAARAKNDERIVSINKKKEEEELEKRRAQIEIQRVRESVKDIEMRAREIKMIETPEFKDVKVKVTENGYKKTPESSDDNFYTALTYLFGTPEEPAPDRPHFDTFSARYLDYKGEEINKNYVPRDVSLALFLFGFKERPYARITNLLQLFAAGLKRNHLVERMKNVIPKWDGKPRLETELMNRINCFDTPLNRRFGRYFWLSLYCRVMAPGCIAPISLALIGAQGSGKSRLANEISKVISGDQNREAVPLTWGKNQADELAFLRNITGKSVIANASEMAGFSSAVMEHVKSFTTRNVDTFDYKYGQPIDQPRQWVIMMDGNKYDGLQRDETGNRRFYPMFVGQKDNDDAGKPQWNEKYKVKFEHFENSIMQVMAECREWIEENGMEGYEKYVNEIVDEVKDFNIVEMNNDRGTTKDDELDEVLIPAIIKSLRKFNFILREDNENVNRRPNENFGAFIHAIELKKSIEIVATKNFKINSRLLNLKLNRLGVETFRNSKMRGYLIRDATSIADVISILGLGDSVKAEDFEGSRFDKFSRAAGDSGF